MTDPETLDLTRRDTFPWWFSAQIRFADLDRQGHVNNVAFAVYCESARVDLFDHWLRPHLAPTEIIALVKITLTYRHELHYPGTVEIGTRVTGTGRSSIKLVQGLFRDGTCVATAEAILAIMDTRTRKSTPLCPAGAASLNSILPQPQQNV